MATGNQFNLYTTYYERFLALSVSIRVGKLHQLKLETPRPQAPVLRYRDITFTSEDIKESLSAVCPVLGVHNVARVRMLGSMLLIEVDFTEVNAIERFCKSLSNGEVQTRLQDRLKFKENLYSPEQDIDVILKLHLVLPNAEKKSVESRLVTTDNYKECFTLIRESALFEFPSLNIAAHHDDVSEEATQPDIIGIDDLHELFKDLLEVMVNWFSVGVFLRISYYNLEAIRKDFRDQSKDCLREMLATWLRNGNASPALLVQALISAGYSVLAKKMAVKHGVTTVPRIAEVSVQMISGVHEIQVHQLRSPALDKIRQEIATKDTQCSSFSDQLDELKKKESKVMESLEQTKSSLGTAKVKINELKCEQQSLIEKREKKQSSKKWLIWQKSYTFGEDLDELNQKIKKTEEVVDELSQKIDELEETIITHNKQAQQFQVEQQLREKERKELKMKIDEIQKDKEDLDCKLKEDRRKFEYEIQELLTELKLSKNKVEVMMDELSHRREVELAFAQANSRAQNASPLLQMDSEYINTKMELKKDELSHRGGMVLVRSKSDVHLNTMKEDELFHRGRMVLVRSKSDVHLNGRRMKLRDMLFPHRGEFEVNLAQANSDMIAPPLLHEHKHDGYLFVLSRKKLLGLFQSTKWVSVFAVLKGININFYQDHKMVDDLSVIDSFHLLHAKISEVINTKGKKYKHIIKLSSPTEKELHLGVDALSTMKEWSSAIQAAINHTDHPSLTRLEADGVVIPVSTGIQSFSW